MPQTQENERSTHQPSRRPRPVRRSPVRPPRRPVEQGIEPVVPRPKGHVVGLLVPLFLLLAGPVLGQDPALELQRTLRQLQEEGEWVQREMQAVEAERRTFAEAQATATHDLPMPVVAPKSQPPEPMRRAQTVAAAPPKPPRFTGRSKISEIAYALEEAVVECIAFRVCVVFLEPGEQIVDRNLGDVDHWNYREGYAGPTGAETPAITVQPLDWDLETNLIVFTDRRVYRIALRGMQKPKAGSTVEFTEALRFRYPQRGMHIAEPPRPLPTVVGTAGGAGANASARDLGSLHFGYQIELPRKRRARFDWRPTAVFDDGERLFVYLPEAAFVDDAPILVGLADNDEAVQVNAVLERDARTGRRYFEVPRLIGSLELFLGQGRDRRWLRIHRQGVR